MVLSFKSAVDQSTGEMLVAPEVTLRNLCEDGDPNVLADQGRLSQILFNIVGNACKFTRSGDVKIYCRAVAAVAATGEGTLDAAARAALPADAALPSCVHSIGSVSSVGLLPAAESRMSGGVLGDLVSIPRIGLVGRHPGGVPGGPPSRRIPLR